MRSRTVLLLLAPTLALFLSACGGGGSGGGSGVGTSLIVTTLADSGPGSLREAVALSSGTPTESILFDPALQGGTIALTTPIVLTTSVWRLEGLVGGQRMTLDGQGLTHMFEVPPGLTLRVLDLEFRNGSGGNGGAIDAEGALWVEGCLFHNNDASNAGGAIAARNTLMVDRCSFTVNTARFGGALFLIESDRVRIHRSSFLLNVSQSGGAILIVSSDVALVGSTLHANFINHVAVGRGSAISVGTNPLYGPANVRLIGCTVTSNNDATHAASAAVWASSTSELVTLDVRGSLIADNVGSATPDLTYGSNVVLAGGGNLIGVGIGVFGFQNGVEQNLVGTTGIPQTPYIGTIETLPDGRAYRVPNDGFASHDAVGASWHFVEPDDAWVPFLAEGPSLPTLPTDLRGLPRLVGPLSDYGAVERQ